MKNMALARKAGMVGMVGAVLWIVSVVMQYGLGISGPGSGPAWIAHEFLAFAGLIGSIVAYLGLIWGGAFRGRFGTIAVGVYALAYALIVLGGIALLFLGDSESPIFLLFPIGGLLEDIAAILIVIAVIAFGLWNGWQRWMPLVDSGFHLLFITLPMLVGLMSDGPGGTIEFFRGISWFLLALAVYTAQAKPVSTTPSPVAQL